MSTLCTFELNKQNDFWCLSIIFVMIFNVIFDNQFGKIVISTLSDKLNGFGHPDPH